MAWWCPSQHGACQVGEGGWLLCQMSEGTQRGSEERGEEVVCRNGRKGSGFYRRVSSTVGRQWRMVEVQVQCARALGEGGTMLLTSSRSSGCGRRTKSWSGASGHCRCPCGCQRRARRLRAVVGPGEVSVGFLTPRGAREEKRGGPGMVGIDGNARRPWACVVGMTMPVMASSAGAGASWPGRCSGSFGRGKAQAWSGG